jgi:hypothetical protein
MGRLRTRIEVYKDGHREVYHDNVDPAKSGYAWTHADDKAARNACSACTSGTLQSVRSVKKETK